MINKNHFCMCRYAACWMAGMLLSGSASASTLASPNILFILADNLGYGELGSYGGGATRGHPTPNLDRLAVEGLRLTNMNMDMLCTPSRSAILTGRYAIRSGTYSVPFGGENDGLTRWEITIAEAVKERGYSTGYFGKWHLGSKAGRLPTDQGFDSWYGIPRTSDEALWPEHKQYSSKIIPPEQVMESTAGGHVHDVAEFNLKERSLIDAELVRRSVAYMKEQAAKKKPFFAFVSLTQVHFPVIPNPAFAGKTQNGDFSDAMVEMDSNVGQLVGTVDQLGLAKNTIIIFTSDNGPEPEGWSGPWGPCNLSATESCIRVPFIARWTGHIQAGRTSDELVNNTDIFPTLAAFTGAAVPTDRPIDGKDQSAFFLGKASKSARESMPIWFGQIMMAVKWKNWKMQFYRKDEIFGPAQKLGFPSLINIWSDPMEKHPVQMTWPIKPLMDAVRDFNDSVTKYPPIPMGTKEPYTPTTCENGCSVENGPG